MIKQTWKADLEVWLTMFYIFFSSLAAETAARKEIEKEAEYKLDEIDALRR